MPVAALLGLALLAVPRVILHDLHLIEEWAPLTWVLAILPVLIWSGAAVLVNSPRPFLTVLLIGLIFGVMLVATHQLMWESAFRGNPPSVGSGPLRDVIPRIAAVPSGLFTGVAIGAIGGLVAQVAAATRRRLQDPPAS